jgi:transcription antitermination protein NusB
MISRRSIRVKVMQTLYTLATLDEGARAGARKLLDDKFESTLSLFTTCVLYVIRIAQHAEADALQRSNRYLKDEHDVNTKIAGNEFVAQLLSNESFSLKVKRILAQHNVSAELVRKVYGKFIKTPEYNEYIATADRNPKDEKKIVQFLWEKQLLEDDEAMQAFADELPGWEEDREIVEMLMQNLFRGIKTNFLNLLSADKLEYAHSLLATTLEKEEYSSELISPKLNNWDIERIAIIDMLLLRMGVCELLYFSTIPTKVTINEYIEIAKLYSTPQSGHFINGVLDNILKDLIKENKIKKTDRSNK